MSVPESKIVKIVDESVHTRGVSVEQVGMQGAIIAKIVEMPEVTVGAPVGGATSDNQTNGSQKTQIVDAGGEAVTVTGGKLDVNASVDTTGLALDATLTNNSQVSQIVDASGNAVTVTGNKLDVNASVDTTGLALDNTLTDGSQHTVLVDGTNTPLTTTGNVLNVIADTGLDTNISSLLSQQTDGSAKTQVVDALNTNVDFATETTLSAVKTSLETAGGQLVNLGANNDVTVTGTVTANAGTNLNTSLLALESGGNLATIAGKDFATQTTLALVKAKTDNIPPLGQALAAASVPVVLTAAQLTTLTPPAAITGFATETTLASIKDTAGIKKIADALPAGTNLLGKVGIDQTTPGTTNKVTLGSDVVHTIVDSGSITVGSHAVTNAGTFAVQVDGSALTSLQLIDDSIYTDGSGTVTKGIAILGQDGTNPQAIKTDAAGELQVDVLTMPTVAVTQSGTWDEVGINDSGNSITVDYATTGSGTATGALRVELPTNGTGVLATVGAVTAITNALPAGTNTLGAVKSVPSDIDINGSNANHADKYYTNAGAVTDGIIWSPAAGKRWHVLTLYINVSAAATVTLEDDLAGGDVARWKGELAANSGVVLTYDKEHPFCSAEDAADLIITTSAGNVYVQAVGYEV